MSHETHWDAATRELIARAEARGAERERRRIEDAIEAELVCCDVFERLSGRPASEWSDDERLEHRRHAICYWGAAAAALAAPEATR